MIYRKIPHKPLNPNLNPTLMLLSCPRANRVGSGAALPELGIPALASKIHITKAGHFLRMLANGNEGRARFGGASVITTARYLSRSTVIRTLRWAKEPKLSDTPLPLEQRK